MGGANAPRFGAAELPRTLLVVDPCTKHASIALVVLSCSRYTCAKPSTFMLQLPLHPVKSTAGTVTRHGSLAGTAPVPVPPIPSVPPTSAEFRHGSVEALSGVPAAEQDASLAAKPLFAGPELALFPGEEPIELPME